MDAILLTWRWQNFLSIAIMVIVIGVIATYVGQVVLKRGGGVADNA